MPTKKKSSKSLSTIYPEGPDRASLAQEVFKGSLHRDKGPRLGRKLRAYEALSRGW